MQRVATIDKCLDVIEAVQSAGNGGLGIRALARELGINPTTVHNICRTLSARGYLIQETQSRRFRLGAAWLPLAREGEMWSGLGESADELVRQCCQELDESIMLAVVDRVEITPLVYYPSSQSLRVDEPRLMGARAYGIAAGKLLLSTLSNEGLDRYRERFPPASFTEATITDPETFRQELQATRERGYAQTRDEVEPGISAVAVPVLDPHGATVAALGASAPTVRLNASQARKARSVLQRFGKKISRIWFDGTENP